MSRRHTGQCQRLDYGGRYPQERYPCLWHGIPTCVHYGALEGEIPALTKQEPGHPFRWTIRDADEGGEVDIAYSTEAHGWRTMTLTYARRPMGFGGSRQCWRCPRDCGQLVDTLYRPLDEPDFACRHCWGLLYESQYQTPLQRWKAKRWNRWHRVIFYSKPRKVRRSVWLDEMIALQKWKEREVARTQEKQARAEEPKRPPGRPREKRAYRRQQPGALTPRTSETQAYCGRCHDRREMVGGWPVRFSNGRPAVKGTCAICGAGMTRIVAGETVRTHKQSLSQPWKEADPYGSVRVGRA